MTIAEIQVAVDDPSTGFAPERILTADERFFLDGPVSARVAVVDRDSSNGRLWPPVPWDAAKRTYETGAGLPSRAVRGTR
jgi:hypothetical protein